jgi:hypothetical protein
MRQIEITGHETAQQVSDAFNSHFEYLKLQFFIKSHEANAPSARKEMIDSGTVTGKMHGFLRPGVIRIDPSMHVSDFEQEFHDLFGLNVQVFRKSGGLWLETSVTDHMTLKEQNALGREKSFPVGKEDTSDFDYE